MCVVSLVTTGNFIVSEKATILLLHILNEVSLVIPTQQWAMHVLELRTQINYESSAGVDV